MRAERNRLLIPAGTDSTDSTTFTSPRARACDVETRFAKLAGDSWTRLPAPIRRRFSRHLAEGQRIVYLGEAAATHMTLLGRLVAQLARLVGAPPPLEASGCLPVAVIGPGSDRLRAPACTRVYQRPPALPQRSS